jgi:hypothetical protein
MELSAIKAAQSGVPPMVAAQAINCSNKNQ